VQPGAGHGARPGQARRRHDRRAACLFDVRRGRAAGRLRRHEREQQALDALAYVRRRADEAGVPCETLLAAEAAPFEAIERAAREHGCDLVVVAARARRGLRARLLGGETEKLLAYGTVPLLILR
jgi:nucleotide-binding universal stress UspA family protein